MRRDGELIPGIVELTHGGLILKCKYGRDTGKSDLRRMEARNNNFQRSEEVSSQKGDDSLLGFTEVAGHVGSLYDPEIPKVTRKPALHSILPKKLTLVSRGEN